jgi:type I site-specific restriction-modification system R (restriction) subunit
LIWIAQMAAMGRQRTSERFKWRLVTRLLGLPLEGVFEPSRFLSLIRDFTVFANASSGLVKIVAGYHQFHAVRRAVVSTIRAIPVATRAVARPKKTKKRPKRKTKKDTHLDQGCNFR